jgi:membrane-bound lytic murein transglycosylase B
MQFVKNIGKHLILVFMIGMCSASTTMSRDVVHFAINNKNTIDFIEEFSHENIYSKDDLVKIFSMTIMKEKKITKSQKNQAEKKLTWESYKNKIVTMLRVNGGRMFLYDNKEVLDKVEKEYNVYKEVIVAILGVETNYGLSKGKYRAIDALSTLSFEYYPRNNFFKNELKAYLRYVKKNNLSPFDVKSSWAGAIGYAQFIPSSIIAYGIDYDNDGKIDLVNSPEDAIASVANYLKKHGFKSNRYYFDRVSVNHDLAINGLKLTQTCESLGIQLGENYCMDNFKLFTLDDYVYIGSNNFYSITMYNRSNLYAAAVLEIATSLKN